MEDIVVEGSGISKSYRTGSVVTPVLRDVDLSVPRGECLFLVGPSGSGKTTLLSILGCVLTADSGRLTILGEDVTRLRSKNQARFRRERIGFVFQRFHLFKGLRAWENVRVVYDLLGRPKREGKQKSLHLLEMVGLAERAHFNISQLSMGQRQRVALARALAADPELILADEPTASLDEESGANAMRILKELCRKLHKTVIVVTHDNRIFPMADRILKLEHGSVAEESRSQSPAAEQKTPASPASKE